VTEVVLVSNCVSSSATVMVIVLVSLAVLLPPGGVVVDSPSSRYWCWTLNVTSPVVALKEVIVRIVVVSAPVDVNVGVPLSVLVAGMLKTESALLLVSPQLIVTVCASDSPISV